MPAAFIYAMHFLTAVQVIPITPSYYYWMNRALIIRSKFCPLQLIEESS